MEVLCRARFHETGMIDKFGNLRVEGSDDYLEDGVYGKSLRKGRVRSDYIFSFGKDDFTFAVWVKAAKSSYDLGGEDNLLILRDKENYYYSFRLMLYRKPQGTGRHLLMGSNEHPNAYDDWRIVDTGKDIMDDQWHHLKLVRKDGVFKLFCDGEIIASMARTSFAFPSGLASLCVGSTEATSDVCIDDIVLIRDIALENTKYVVDFPLLYLSDDAAYGKKNGTFQKVAEDWPALSETKKANLFLAIDEEALPEDFQTLGNFKIITYAQSEDQPICRLSAVPKDQLVLPKRYIEIEAFAGIDKVAATLVTSTNAKCKILATTDLKTCRTYNFQKKQWAEVNHKNSADVAAYGIPAAELQNIPRAAWDLLAGGRAGIEFAYLLSVEDPADICEVDKLELIAEEKGSWEKIF